MSWKEAISPINFLSQIMGNIEFFCMIIFGSLFALSSYEICFFLGRINANYLYNDGGMRKIQ